ncbi:hypothetical protein SAMN02745126_05995 [Enhydrobacter aerosaccus]|uniref:Uncharacterized protein n=1 Tax=Enhydrobacter aerosaccus TaxID=225324 RepID=A0A1T4TBY3_9HYPH|nr:hypothetical protein [Enhydrobacter aerosaccus]SKA38025.1 hypothetical protein SAMN02745126_05995 [Enhydrobacter aerosaccus]
MDIAAWLPPLVRALATALIVVSASAVAESLGPFWGALVASLPISAGPAYVFLAMQHDADFVAASALASVTANAATGMFLIVYATLAPRLPLWRSLGAAILAWAASAVALQQIAWTPAAAVLPNLAVYGFGILLGRRRRAVTPAPSSRARRRWYELPLRAAAVAAFVSLIVGISSILGPATTGMAALFPVSFISLIVIVHLRMGGAVSGLIAANAMLPMVGFGAMLLALHLAIAPLGVTAALLLALAISLLWSALLLLTQTRRYRH